MSEQLRCPMCNNAVTLTHPDADLVECPTCSWGFDPDEAEPWEEPPRPKRKRKYPLWSFIPTLLLLTVSCCLAWSDYWAAEHWSGRIFKWVAGALTMASLGIIKRDSWSIEVRCLVNVGLAVVGLVGAIVLFSLSPTVAPSLGLVIWRPFTLPDGTATVSLPGEPNYVHTPVEETEDGVHMHGVGFPDETVVFSIGHATFRKELFEEAGLSPREMLAIFRSKQNAGDHRLNSTRDIEKLGYPGIETTVFDEGNGTTTVARSYLVGRRLYFFSAVGPNYTPEVDDVKTFLDSIELKPR